MRVFQLGTRAGFGCPAAKALLLLEKAKVSCVVEKPFFDCAKGARRRGQCLAEAVAQWTYIAAQDSKVLEQCTPESQSTGVAVVFRGSPLKSMDSVRSGVLGILVNTAKSMGRFGIRKAAVDWAGADWGINLSRFSAAVGGRGFSAQYSVPQ